MFLFIFIALGLLLLPAGIWLLAVKKLPNLGRIFIMLFAFGAALFGLLVGAIALMSSPHQNFYITMLLIFEALLLALLAVFLWGGFKKKFLSVPLCSLLAACLVVTIGFTSYWAAIDRIPVVGEGSQLLEQYSPFEESKVATLEEPATLTLTGPMPRLDGATALYPVYAAFYKATYGAQYQEDIVCSTTAGAYQSIVEGSSDMIFVAAPSAEQEQYAAENGVELVYTPIGKEAFVFFVNSKNPIDNLTVGQIQSIYSGQTDRWSDLGVDGLGSIRAFQREEGSGSQSALLRLMGDTPLMDPPEENVVIGMGGIIQKAADYKNYKNAIGYSFRFYSTEMVQNNQIKLLSVEGIAPTEENVANGTYPIASEFYAVTRKDCSENTQKLLDWILSEQGQRLIAETGYTPLKP